MLNITGKDIVEDLRGKPMARTYGEVFADIVGMDPFTVTYAANALAPKVNYRGNLEALNVEHLCGLKDDEAFHLYSEYSLNFAPKINELIESGKVKHICSNKRVPCAAHTNFVSNTKGKIVARVEDELRKKAEIAPVFYSLADEAYAIISGKFGRAVKRVMLMGSCAPNNNRPFIRYGDLNEIKGVSDMNLAFVTEYRVKLNTLAPWVQENKTKRKLAIKPFCIHR